MADISVIVPMYNVKKYLKECLGSLAAQTLRQCEFICIDDGSSDGSYQTAELYSHQDSRFKLIRQGNRGLAETRNVGIREAKGEYLVFLDSDDFFSDAEALERIFLKAESSELELLSFEAELLYEGDMERTHRKDSYYQKTHSYDGIRTGKDFLIEMMSHHEYCDSACLLAVRRTWILEQGIWFYPGVLYEDALFCIQCLIKAERMAHLPERCYTYRVREQSIMTSKIRWENVRSRVVICAELLRLLVSLQNQERELLEAVADYTAQVVNHIKYLDEFKIQRQSRDMEDPFQTLLLKAMEVGKYGREVNENVILCGLEKIAADSDGVILYGAGNVGRLLFRFLDEKGLRGKILCYAVSKKPEEERTIDGILVLPIKEAIRLSGHVILSVTDSRAQREMERRLEELGVEQYELFDRYMYRALRHYAQRTEGTGDDVHE